MFCMPFQVEGSCLEKVKDNWLCSRALTCTLHPCSQRQQYESRSIFGQGMVTLASHGTMAAKKTLCGKQVIGSSNAFLLNPVNDPRSICFANHNLRALRRISLVLLCSIALHKATRRWTGFACHALHGKLSRGW